MIIGILLAAGRSQRMGQPKLLLPWHGVPLIRHVAQSILQSKLDHLVVVIGHRAEHVRAALADVPIEIVHNAAFPDGQSTSLRAGIAAVRDRADAIVVLLADQPLLRPDTIDALIDAYQQTGARIVAPVHRGQRGNPILFAGSVFDELLAISGDQGARNVIKAHADEVLAVEVEDTGVVLDIDTPDMYAQLLEHAGTGNDDDQG
jgi:molybdenum cofactor cytidylyltransferase